MTDDPTLREAAEEVVRQWARPLPRRDGRQRVLDYKAFAEAMSNLELAVQGWAAKRREHVLSKDCWCNPRIEYVPPESRHG